MSRKKILQGIIAGMAAVSIINAGCIKDVKAETAEVVNTKVVTEDNSVSVRSSKKVWVYKEENGKRYMRLYDATNQVWLTDWIVCA
ncbi:MAG: hypothetical protein K1W19_12075 [Lachnospiraceae bacterium]|jgi:hypothetical protein|nr:hypothetical protein [Lachnospiraceae bacterium]MCI8825777.1 hypothetical protein [Lachnospiraceae bacterium]MCI9370465.1 hypothetical protein [Lachnospiraceae bacterium]